MKYFNLIYFCVGIFTFTNAAPTFDLKIEYNQTLDKLTALDRMNVAFVNKLSNEAEFINNGITDNKLLPDPSKHPLKHDSDIVTTLENSRTDSINTDTEPTTATFKRLDKDDIKQQLNSFAMAKRKTYYVTPAFTYPRKNEDSIDLPSDNNFNNEHFNYQDFNDDNNILTQDKTINVPNRNKRNQLNNYKKTEEKDIISILNRPEVIDILKKQNYLIDKLENLLRTEKIPKLRSDFDDLLTSIENKKNKKDVDIEQKRITAITTTTPKLSTVMTMVDQTEVRKALMQDPFVQRILKMAKQKKMEYMKNAKKQYGNMLYI